MKVNLPEVNSTDLKYALEQDKNDPLAHFRERFHLPKTDSGEPFIYFCGNSLGLQPHSASTFIQQELDAWKKFGVEGHLHAKRPWMPYHEFFTQYSAELVGAFEKEVEGKALQVPLARARTMKQNSPPPNHTLTRISLSLCTLSLSPFSLGTTRASQLFSQSGTPTSP